MIRLDQTTICLQAAAVPKSSATIFCAIKLGFFFHMCLACSEFSRRSFQSISKVFHESAFVNKKCWFDRFETLFSLLLRAIIEGIVGKSDFGFESQTIENLVLIRGKWDFCGFIRTIMIQAAGQSGMLMKTLVGGSRPLARDPSV